jgi:hypothetical protein
LPPTNEHWVPGGQRLSIQVAAFCGPKRSFQSGVPDPFEPFLGEVDTCFPLRVSVTFAPFFDWAPNTHVGRSFITTHREPFGHPSLKQFVAPPPSLVSGARTSGFCFLATTRVFLGDLSESAANAGPIENTEIPSPATNQPNERPNGKYALKNNIIKFLLVTLSLMSKQKWR